MAKKGTSPKTSTRKPGSGALIRTLIMKNTATDDIIKAVHKAFSGSKAGPSDVAWNRNKLKKDGKKLPSKHTGRQASSGNSKDKPKKAGPKAATKKVAKRTAAGATA